MYIYSYFLKTVFVEKWTRYFPNGEDDDNLELERHDSLNCDCLPTCDSVYYKMYTNSFPLGESNRNISKINIFFINGFGSLYKIDMTFTWFEVISAYGGLMSLVMGLSLISIIEVLVLQYKLIFYYAHKLYSQTIN
ncbi:uncharacterized protein LOC108904531 [Anoplophora glabripennis]|uniref:uncharacterized protein LOC108904531 n=1 Tax=Anoplophora glabripennis TaxID=217634 RepID=UPI000875A3B1|nr:uncharacterized protein LOC108904531 [Anoplophora glabripennis]